MNWHKRQLKRSWNTGIPLMDQYTDGYRPLSSNHRKDPRSLVNANPELGGEKREGYSRNTSSLNSDPTESEKIKESLPGENVLMDQDPPTGEGVRNEEFTARGEGNSDVDVLPMNSNSKKLDRGKIGPHNMGKSVFQKYRDKRIKGLNLVS